MMPANAFAIPSLDKIKQAVEDTNREEFILLRNARDVIKKGMFRIWDASPDQTCPMQAKFYRCAGIRIVGPGRDLATHE